MSPKRVSESSIDAVKKKQRKSLSLELKLEVLRRLESGERQTDVCQALSLAGSTVRTIWKNAEKIHERAKAASPLAAARLSRSRATIMVEMERLLSLWIEDQIEHQIPLNLTLIQEKARTLYDDLKKDFPDKSDAEPFIASRGWFNRFKRRVNLYSVAAVAEETASTDDQAADGYKNELVEIIEKGGYTPHQVFNVDEIGLYWKKMPGNSFVSREEKTLLGYKASKDRLTLLLGGNAAGDFKLKPMLVYHSETPRVLKGYSKNCLPVIWRSNRKARVTRQVFESWFTAYFCPAVKEYCAENHLDNKALLILDNAPGHPTTLEDFSQSIQVLFLPPKITSHLQPMDQGIVTSFRTNYVKKMFTQAARAIDGQNAVNVKDFWKSYNIRHAIENIVDAWDEVSPAIMNQAWRNLWNDCIQHYQAFDDLEEVAKENIVELGKKVGLEELVSQDIQELIDSYDEELSEQDLLEVQERALEEESIEEDDALEAARTLTIHNLEEFFKHLNNALTVISENDPDMQRSLCVTRGINNLVSCYRELYDEKNKAKKQLSLDSFFFRSNPKNNSDKSAASRC